jgi:replicative DNA helicase
MADLPEPEYATIGALLLAPRELKQVVDWLRPEDFARTLCGEVYLTIVKMDRAGIPVDPITVREELRKTGKIRRDGYPSMELVRMVESVPSPLSVGYYGRLVIEAALYRRVEQAGTRLAQAGASRRGEVDDVFGLIRAECTGLLSLRRRHSNTAAAGPGRGGPTAIATLLRDPAIPNPQARARAVGD